jgi:apolipoprotein N-acyltransferase
MSVSRIFKEFSLPILSGIALILCFPKFDLFLLAWIAITPFLISTHDRDFKESFLKGVTFGITYFFGTLYWVYHSINHYGGIPFLISILVVLILCFYLSIYTGIFASLFSFAVKRSNLPAMIIAPTFWVVIEFIRSYALTGFPWSIIGYTQYKFLTMIQIADITGVYGISFLVLAVNGALTDIYITKRRLISKPLSPLYPVIFGTIILILILLTTLTYGWFRLSHKAKGRDIVVSIIQGNIEQDRKWNAEYQEYVIDTYFKLSRLVSSKNPSLIVWPETSLPFIFGMDKGYSDRLQEFQRELNTYLLVGSILVREKGNDKHLLTNSALLFDRDGKIIYTYDKIHLVPFGEYIPLRKILFFIDKLAYGIGDYVSGTSYKKAETSVGSFAAVICYEIIFPGMIRKFFKDGGDFLVNITNDAWFGRTSGPYQHFSMIVYRAIENRKPVIRAANTGISGFVDSNGNIISKTDIFKRCYLTERIKTDNRISFYSRYGDIFVYLCMVISVYIIVNLYGKKYL